MWSLKSRMRRPASRSYGAEMNELRSFGVTGADALAGASSASLAFARWQSRWTPEAIAARKAEERTGRERERAESEPVPLTLDGLLAKLAFSREYAEHLMQPYCRCECGHDGWHYCEHAEDLGWPRLDWISQ